MPTAVYVQHIIKSLLTIHVNMFRQFMSNMKHVFATKYAHLVIARADD